MTHDYRFLVLEDFSWTRYQLVTILKSHFDCVVVEVRDDIRAQNEFAKQHYRNEAFDAVFVDIDSSNAKGLDAIAVIKAINPNVKLLATSTMDNVSLIERAMEIGVQAFIKVKPGVSFQFFDEFDVVEIIRNEMNGTSQWANK